MPLGLIHGSRSRILAVICLIILGLFVVRLFQLQVIDHGKYASLADQEQRKRLVIPAKRGEIYMMDAGKPAKVVLNQTVYTVFADPQIVTEPDKIVAAVRRIAGGNARKNLEDLVALKDTRYQILATRLSHQQAKLLKEEELSGLGFQETSQRVYPEGRLAAQTLGFVNNEGQGQYGIEGGQNDRLKGVDGVLESVTDVSNVPLTIGDRNIDVPAKKGDDLVLTIDRNIQSYAEKSLATNFKRLGVEKGSVIVMDPANGHVLAMANVPTYNPAEFNKVTNAEAFNNATVATPYEPGSVMKTFTVAMGIDKGAIMPDSTFVNTDYIKIDDRTISNASKGQTGTITFQHALNWSLNTGMVTIAQRLGDGSTINGKARGTMYEYLHDRFGLGELTGIGLGGEAAGSVIPPTDVEGNAVRYSNMTFGQGMNITMLQVAAGFSAIVNGGVYHKPRVIAGRMDEDGVYRPDPAPASRRVVSESTSRLTKKMVHGARNAFYSALDKKGYYIGGKTGTSEVLVNGAYTDSSTTASYLGFGGDSTPRYVIMVQASSARRHLAGNEHAMPVFTDISNWLLDYMKIQPKGY